MRARKEDRLPPETRGGGRLKTRRVTATGVLLVGAIGLLLYFAHVAFVPIALALLFALILSSPVESLYDMKIPRALSAVVLMLAILGAIAGILNLISEPAQQWFAAAPHTVKIIEKKIRPFEQLMSRVEALRNSAGNIGSPGHAAAAGPGAGPGSTPASAPASAAQASGPAMLFDATRNAVLSTMTVVILTLFLLAGGPPMMARMTAALVSHLNSAHVMDVIEKVRSEVGRFYVTTVLINIGLGVATGCAMLACGMPNPFLWGTIAGMLNFIPYAGSTVTLILLTLVAIVSFDGYGRVLAVTGSYLTLAALEGQVAQPLLVGRRLELNPMLVFLALWFGGLFWGIAGIVLATPTLVALKVLAQNSADGRPVLEFLSPETSS